MSLGLAPLGFMLSREVRGRHDGGGSRKHSPKKLAFPEVKLQTKHAAPLAGLRAFF